MGNIGDINVDSDYLLTPTQMTMTVTNFISTYASGVTRNTTGEGATAYDVSVYQWDNYI